MTREQRLRELVHQWRESYALEQDSTEMRHAKELEAILNEESEGWLPIETAPEGKKVLCVWFGAPGCDEIDTAVLCDAIREVPFWCSPDDLTNEYGKPDMWQLLPAAPTRPADGSQK